MPGAAGSVSRAGSRGFAELICSCVHLLLLSSSDSTSQGAAAAVPALLAIYLFRAAWGVQGLYHGISLCGSGVCISTAPQDR